MIEGSFAQEIIIPAQALRTGFHKIPRDQLLPVLVRPWLRRRIQLTGYLMNHFLYE